MEALILYAKDEKMIRFLGKLFTSLCQSVSPTIQASVGVILSVSSVFLSILRHDFYCNFNKIHASKGMLSVRRKLVVIKRSAIAQG